MFQVGGSQEVTSSSHLDMLSVPGEMPAAQDLIPQPGRGGIGEQYPRTHGLAGQG